MSTVAKTGKLDLMSLGLKLIRGHLTRASVLRQLVADLLTLVEVAHPGSLNGGDGNKDVLAGFRCAVA